MGTRGSWKMESYSTKELSEKLKKGTQIKIPKFQRNLVWKPKQKELFIDSIKKGYPFGSILLYEDENHLQLIDGLQRSNTISEFINNPSNFFNDADIDDDVIRKIVKRLNFNTQMSQVQQEVRSYLIEWIRKYDTMDQIERLQYFDFAYRLMEYYPTAKDVLKEITELIEPMLSEFQNICKTLANAQVPAIVFSGDKILLPEVFERINSKGTQLSKYQIFAATWVSEQDLKILKKDLYPIIDHVKERYEIVLEKDFDIEDYDPVELSKNKELDVFNVIFGFGKLLNVKFPYLFGEIGEKDKVVSEAFTIVNACLGKPTSELEKLHTNLYETFGRSHEQINNFFVEILKTIEMVNDNILRGIHKFKGNIRNSSKKSPLHTELQISSIIAATFLLQYGVYGNNSDGDRVIIGINLSEKRKDWNKGLNHKKSLKQNLYKIYIMDILLQKWRGSGDKKLNTILNYPETYARPVEWKEFNSVLDNWFNSVLNDRKEKEKVRAPKEEEKVILNLLYMKKLTAYDHLSDENYDYEHLATKKALKNKIENIKEECTLPISSIGNLCLLPEYVNRKKRDKPLFEDTNYINKINKKISLDDLKNKFSLMQENDLDWLKEEINDCQILRSKYINFLNLRFNRIKESIKADYFE